MPSYSLLAAQVGYSFKIREYVFTYYLSGHNLLNVEARPQNSLLKYLAPLPGRNISLGIKIQLWSRLDFFLITILCCFKPSGATCYVCDKNIENIIISFPVTCVEVEKKGL